MTGRPHVDPHPDPGHTEPAFAPTGLRVGDRPRPLCVDGAPSFGWTMPAGDSGYRQSAYQVRVECRGRLVWDSGRVASADQSYVPYGGPALEAGTPFSWRVRVWDGQGRASAWSEPSWFEAGLGDNDWEASWLRAPGWRPTESGDLYFLARREIDLGTGPMVRVRLYVASYHQHELRVDGRTVCRGPAFSYPDQGYYQAVDVTELISGGGRVAVGAVVHWYGAGQGRPAAEPGFLLRLVAEHEDGSRQVLVTDGAWRTSPAAWLPSHHRNDDGVDYVELIDGRAEQRGWDRPGFDDRGWEPAEVVGTHPTAPFLHLTAQEPDLAFHAVEPVSVRPIPSGGLVADFGQVIPAVPVVAFANGRPGHHVPLAAGYVTESDGTVSRVRGVQKTDMSYGYIQTEGRQRFRPFTYLGFRYLEVGGGTDAADVESIGAIIQHLDVDPDDAATFACSVPVIARVFDVAMRSALYSSQGQFLDTPTREKGQFLADAVNISQAIMGGFRDRAFTRKAIRELMSSQRRYWPQGQLNAVYPNGDGARDIPDFTAMFPGWVHDYYLESGDGETLQLAYPAMRAVCGYLLGRRQPETGLVCDPAGGGPGPYAGGIVDWPPTMRYGFDMAVQVQTPLNLLAVSAVTQTAAAAGHLGLDEDRQRLLHEAASLVGAINARLRRADGLYADGRHRDGGLSRGASQIANAYALCFGAVPEPDRPDVCAHVAGLGMRMGPMTAFRLLEALAGGGRLDRVVELLVDAEGPGWASSLAQGGTFTWESWDAPRAGNSLSHGWGSNVLVTIQRHLLGVHAIAPAAARLRIRPALEHLEWARGTVPTQRGPVSVEWGADGRATALEVRVPANAEAEVCLPPGYAMRSPRSRTEEGATGSGSYVLGSGTWRFERESSSSVR